MTAGVYGMLCCALFLKISATTPSAQGHLLPAAESMPCSERAILSKRLAVVTEKIPWESAELMSGPMWAYRVQRFICARLLVKFFGLQDLDHQVWICDDNALHQCKASQPL